LLKPNLLRAMPPEKACTTHPTVVAAVARLVIEVGAHPVIIESPGGPYAEAYLRLIYRKTGMLWAAEVSGAELNYDIRTTQVSYAEGIILHRLDLVQPVVEADVLINLAKLKTHNLTTLTLAVKNLFGLVPGVLKIGYHAKLQDAKRFSESLVDIATYAKPALNIIDAIVTMEGNGPSGGDPRQVGAILTSDDALTADIAASALVSYDPLEVTTTRVAVQHELTSGRVEDIQFLGDSLDSLRVRDFRHGTATAVDPGLVPRKFLNLIQVRDSEEGAEGYGRKRSLFQRLTSGWMARQLVVVPSAGAKCIGCGVCVKSCPVNAITLVNKVARMDRNKCIRCYCCHELCPELAVELHRPWLGRLVMGS
jgi:uncharacterized protein (DUF362 family)/ferredoxin